MFGASHQHDDLGEFGLGHLMENMLPQHDGEPDVEQLMLNPMAASVQMHDAAGKMSSHHHSDAPGVNRPLHEEEERDDAYVLLRRLRLLPKNDGYAYVSDLDAFFSSLYNYYYHRGLGSVVGKGVVEIASLFFTLWLSLVLFAYIDWSKLARCSDEHTCGEYFVESYVVRDPFSAASVLRSGWSLVYAVLFSAYGAFCVVQFWYTVRASIEAKLFLEEVLGFCDRDLEIGRVEWADIVDRMSEAQRTGQCKVAILPGVGPGNMRGSRSSNAMQGHNAGVAEPTDYLVVAQRIMRRENFLIAFFNIGLLDLTIPSLPSRLWPLTMLTNRPREEQTVWYSKSIEFALHFCMLNYMFNTRRKVRPAFYGNPSALRRRFVICGVAHLVFMPFLIFFVCLHFFMSNVYDWQSTKDLGPREWSSLAKWKFREFNELPDTFERRLNPSYKSAAAYLDLSSKPSPFKVAFGRLLVFVSGSLGTLLLCFAALNDAILLHVKIGQWNLLWFAGVLGVCFSVGKSMLPKPNSPYLSRCNLVSELNAELENMASHTHYLPDSWKGKGYDEKIKSALVPMFQFKAQHFVNEVMSLMVAPIILCFSLPRCADRLCQFIRDSKAEVPGVGDVVGYSLFDFDLFEDENWQVASSHGRNEYPTISALDLDEAANFQFKTRHGKMEKSFYSFKHNYPKWEMTPSSLKRVIEVEAFRREQDMAQCKERQLHVQAAKAQLEHLQRLQLLRERKATLAGLSTIRSQHLEGGMPLSGPQSGPDSGAGCGVLGMSTMPSFDSSMGSLSHDEEIHQNVHFESSSIIGGDANAPPSHAFSYHGSNILNRPDEGPFLHGHFRCISPTRQLRNQSPLLNDPARLSLQLREVLNGSMHSFTGSLVPVDESILDSSPIDQYNILNEYHSARDGVREERDNL